MEGHSVISSDILASYAADAAREVSGVHGLVESTIHRHKGVKVTGEEGRVVVELHLAVHWDASIPELAPTDRDQSEGASRTAADPVPEEPSLTATSTPYASARNQPPAHVRKEGLGREALAPSLPHPAGVRTSGEQGIRTLGSFHYT